MQIGGVGVDLSLERRDRDGRRGAALVIKTSAERFDAMQARLVAEHPYDVPEVLAIDPAAGYAPYLAWVERETCAE